MFPVEKLTNIVNQLQHKSVTTDYFACLSLILQLIGLVVGPILIVIGFYVGLYLIKKKLISTLDKDVPINMELCYNLCEKSPEKYYVTRMNCLGHPKQRMLNAVIYIYWGLVIASALLLFSPFLFMSRFICIVVSVLSIIMLIYFVSYFLTHKLEGKDEPLFTNTRAQRYKDIVIARGNAYINNLSQKKRTISKEDMPALMKDIEEWIEKVPY